MTLLEWQDAFRTELACHEYLFSSNVGRTGLSVQNVRTP